MYLQDNIMAIVDYICMYLSVGNLVNIVNNVYYLIFGHIGHSWEQVLRKDSLLVCRYCLDRIGSYRGRRRFDKKEAGLCKCSIGLGSILDGIGSIERGCLCCRADRKRFRGNNCLRLGCSWGGKKSSDLKVRLGSSIEVGVGIVRCW